MGALTSGKAKVKPSADGEAKGGMRMLAVLRELAQHPDGIQLDDLSRRLESPKSSVHRVLAMLGSAGFAAQDGSGRYRVGLDFVRLAFEYHEKLDSRSLVHPVLEELVERFGTTAHYAELIGGDVVCIDKVSPLTGTIRLTRIGGRNPAHCTAVGKAILAHLLSDRAAVEGWVAEHGPLEKRTRHTLTSAPAFWADLKKTKTRGYALDDEEDELGVVCFAIPLFFGHPGRPSGAISISSVTTQMTRDKLTAASDEIEKIVRSHLGTVTRPPD